MSGIKRSHEGNPKRPHASLTIIQKVEIIKKLSSGTSVNFTAKSYGISPRTVYDIRKNKEKILKFYASSDSNAGISERKTMHMAKSVDLDKVLYEWFRQRRSEGFPITGPLLCEKAKELHKELKVEDHYNFSSGWLTRFKQRHGIRYLKACGEKLSADKESAEEFIEEFSETVKNEGLSPEQIYNVDETGLFWSSLPQKTLVTSDESNPSSIKESKQRLTVVVCSNAAGTHKCKLLVIGKSAHPRALKGIKMLPVIYRSNKRSWMTRELMIDWFQNHFVPEARAHCSKIGLPQHCKIVLLLDNCAAHPDGLEKDNVSATFLPPNTTSLIQPMDQGIIRAMKCKYRMEMLRKMIHLNPSGDVLESHKNFFNIKDAIFLIAQAWNCVPQETLVNAWHNIWPASLFIDCESDDTPFNGFPVNDEMVNANELLAFAKNSSNIVLNNLQDQQILDWINSDDHDTVIEEVTDEEIISNTLNSDVISSSETDSDEEVERVTLEQGLSLGDKYLTFLLQQTFVSEQEILTIQRLQEKINKQKNNKYKCLKQTTITSMFSKK